LEEIERRENKVSTVKITQFKLINKYLDDINYNIAALVTPNKDEDG
jgi:hypothetical protein